MRNIVLAMLIAVLAPVALGGVKIETEKLTTPWAVVGPDGRVVSKHETRDQAIEGAANASELNNGEAYRVVFMQSLRVRHVPQEVKPPVLDPEPGREPAGGLTVKVLDAEGNQLAEFATVDEARTDARVRATQNKGKTFTVAVAEIGLTEEYVITPPPPGVAIPSNPTDVDINAMLAGVTRTVWVAPDDEFDLDGDGLIEETEPQPGDGLSRDKPTCLLALYVKDANGERTGEFMGNTAMRFKNGGLFTMKTVLRQWHAGPSADKPLIICPWDLNGEMPRFVGAVKKLGVVAIYNIRNMVWYGIEFNGTLRLLHDGADIELGGGKFVNCYIHHGGNNVYFSAGDKGAPTPLGVEFIGCRITQSYVSCVFSSACNGATFDRCIFDDNGTSGTRDHTFYLADCQGFRITNCWFSRASAAHIKLQTVKNILFEGNTFYGGGYLGAFNANGGQNEEDQQRHNENIVFRHNVADGCGVGIHSKVNLRCDFSDNIFVRCGYVVTFRSPFQPPLVTPDTDIAIRRNKLWNCARFITLDMQHATAPYPAVKRSGVVVEDNDIQGDQPGLQRYVTLSNWEAIGGSKNNIDFARCLDGTTFGGNRIGYTPGGESFYTPVKVNDGGDAASAFISFNEWVKRTGDTSTLARANWPTPRGVDEFAASLGITGDELIQQVVTRKIPPTAARDYMRTGFTK